MRRTLRRLGYAWNHSTDPAVAWSRAAWDGAPWWPAERLLSLPAGNGVTFGLAGRRGGTAGALQILEEHRERSGCGTAGHVRHPSRWPYVRSAAASLAGSDLVVACCGRRQAHGLPRFASVVLPSRVHFVLDTTRGYEAARLLVSRKERHAYAAGRRTHDWKLVPASTGEDFAFFYDRMHVPTMRRRHGDRARSEHRAVAFDCVFRRGLLAFVVASGRRVAGGLCRWDSRQRMLTLRLVGVLDGAGEHYRAGAMRALYHGLLEWACDHERVDRLDLQGTEPFVSRGIFQWKRKFHPRIEIPANHFRHRRLWLHVPVDSSRARDFLVANPVVAETSNGDLEALYFYDSERAVRADAPCGCPGVRRERAVDLDQFLSGAAAPRGLGDRFVRADRRGGRLIL